MKLVYFHLFLNYCRWLVKNELANNNSLETWGVDGNVIWITHVRGVCYLYGGSCRQQIGVKNVLLKY
jgi:hypothetical protein